MKVKLFLLLMILHYHVTNAQTGFYTKFGAGYSFPLAATGIGTNSKQVYLKEYDTELDVYRPSIINTAKEVTGSYSAGITASGGIGYMFSESLGVDITMDYIYGKRYKSTQTSQDIIDDEVINESKNRLTSQSKLISISPGFVLRASGTKLTPYLSTGIILGITTLKKENFIYSDYEEPIRTTTLNEEFSRSISLGVRGAAGIDVKLNDMLFLFSEVSFSGLNFSPKEKVITRYEINGENILATLNERDIRTHYVKNYERDSRDANCNDRDKPTEALRFSLSMNNIITSVGMKMYF